MLTFTNCVCHNLPQSLMYASAYSWVKLTRSSGRWKSTGPLCPEDKLRGRCGRPCEPSLRLQYAWRDIFFTSKNVYYGQVSTYKHTWLENNKQDYTFRGLLIPLPQVHDFRLDSHWWPFLLTSSPQFTVSYNVLENKLCGVEWEKKCNCAILLWVWFSWCLPCRINAC